MSGIGPNTYNPDSDKPVVIYHGGCDDGVGAALAVWLKHQDNYEYYPGVYQKAPPNLKGRSVVFVDFSYKRPVIEQMMRDATDILMLDHHKTAMEEWQRDPVNPFSEHTVYFHNFKAIFDMKRSGAVMAWEHYHPNVIIPRAYHLIQENDLGLNRKPGSKYPETDNFVRGLRSYPHDLMLWKTLLLENPLENLLSDGQTISRYFDNIVRLTLNNAYSGEFIEYNEYDSRFVLDRNKPISDVGQFCTAPYFMASDAAALMAKSYPFGACFFQLADGRWQYSLRSDNTDPDATDVSKIALHYGGGGHKNAAGFTVPELVHVRT